MLFNVQNRENCNVLFLQKNVSIPFLSIKRRKALSYTAVLFSLSLVEHIFNPVRIEIPISKVYSRSAAADCLGPNYGMLGRK